MTLRGELWAWWDSEVQRMLKTPHRIMVAQLPYTNDDIFAKLKEEDK